MSLRLPSRRSLLALAFASSALAADYTPPKPTQAVATGLFEWRDAKRERGVPAKIYYPRDLASPAPIIIFSHGLGGSREGYEYLGRYWAGCGYISVHLQHAGSDSEVWKNREQSERGSALQRAGGSLASAVNRPLDVTFAIDELERLNRDASFPLHGKLDLKHIGVAGHSFGGFTSLAVAGQTFITPLRKSTLGDPRVSAAIQMSAPANRDRSRQDESYATITIPVLHLSGTKDFVPLFPDTKAEDRRLPYDHMHHSQTCFVNFKDGDHMLFAGAPRVREDERQLDAADHPLICLGTTVFWDAYLRQIAGAKSWLLEGNYAKALAERATFEHKSPVDSAR